MKICKLIYNPRSGHGNFPEFMDEAVAVFQNHGYECHLFRSSQPGAIKGHVEHMPKPDIIAVAGGDGTVNEVINSLQKRGLDVPVGIFPVGTANDFAGFLGMSRDISLCAKMIASGRHQNVDLGVVNGDRYFINVCAAGFLTEVSQQVDATAKNNFGKLAYYVKGLEKLSNLTPIDVMITNSKTTFKERIYLMLALNTWGTGGFERLVPQASITDGQLEFLAVKACPLSHLTVLSLKILAGDFLGDSNIIYFRDSYVKVEALSPWNSLSDVDGEKGPGFPLELRMAQGKARLIVPK